MTRERAAGYYLPEAFTIMQGFTEIPFLVRGLPVVKQGSSGWQRALAVVTRRAPTLRPADRVVHHLQRHPLLLRRLGCLAVRVPSPGPHRARGVVWCVPVCSHHNACGVHALPAPQRRSACINLIFAALLAGFMGHLIGGFAPHPAIAGICQLFFVLFNVLMVRKATRRARKAERCCGWLVMMQRSCSARVLQAGSFVPVNLMPAAWAWVNKAVPIAWAGELHPRPPSWSLCCHCECDRFRVLIVTGWCALRFPSHHMQAKPSSSTS